MPVRVRPYRDGDAPALHEAVRESLDDLRPWMPWAHPAYALVESEQWVRAQSAARPDDDEMALAIVDEHGRFLGGTGFNQRNRAHRHANLGYWVRTSATGRGVAAEAARLAASWIFASTDLLRLEILCAVGNVRSQRAAEKTGAVREGVLRDRIVVREEVHDAVMYAIVRSGWTR